MRSRLGGVSGCAWILAVVLAAGLEARQAQAERETREASAQEKEPAPRADERLPPGAGYSLVLEACVQCHDFRPIVSQRKTLAAWKRSVNEMIWKGAPLMPGEAEAVSRYLASAFGTGQPARGASRAARAVKDEGALELARFLPPGPGRALVRGACVQCHDLMLSVSQRKTLSGWRRSVDRMARLGAKLNGGEMEVVAQYLARSFGPDDPIPEAIKKHPGFFTIEWPKGKSQ